MIFEAHNKTHQKLLFRKYVKHIFVLFIYIRSSYIVYMYLIEKLWVERFCDLMRKETSVFFSNKGGKLLCFYIIIFAATDRLSEQSTKRRKH